MAILSIRNVAKSFGAGVDALAGVSLEVNAGEAVAIIGSSGSGKSTLLRCVNHLEKVTAGSITVDGETLVETNETGVHYPPEKQVRHITTKTAMVFQHFNLFPHMTCLDNVTVAPVRILGRPREEANARGMELLETVGLGHKAQSYPDQLSGGQKQRVAIARALAMDPQIMLFDEPTSALDPEITNEVTAVILELVKKHMTMLIVTHDMRFAREAASRLIYMDEGRIVEEGPPAELFERPKSERLQAFLRSFQQGAYTK